MSLFGKAEWEPYIGPQGGEGWRNTENGEIAYQTEPPGDITLPDEFPGELVDFGGEYESVIDLDNDTPVLASDGEGNIIAEEMDNVPEDGFVYGVIEEEDQPQEVSDDEELSTGEWEERDPETLEDIPEGTEVSVELPGEPPIVGEFNGNIGEYTTTYDIGGEEVAPVDLTFDDTELYVNEESLSEEDGSVMEDIHDLIEDDPVVTEQIDENLYGEALIEEAADVWDLPQDSYNVDPADVMVEDVMETAKKIPGVVESGQQDEDSEYIDYTLGGFLKELPDHTMPGDVHSLLEQAEEITSDVPFDDVEIDDQVTVETEWGAQSEGKLVDVNSSDVSIEHEGTTEVILLDEIEEIESQETISSGQIAYDEIDNVEDGSYVELELNDGRTVSGTLEQQEGQGDFMLTYDDGQYEYFSQFEVNSGYVYQEKPEPVDVPENPLYDDLVKVADEVGLGSGSFKREKAEFIAKVFDANPDPYDVAEVLVEKTGGAAPADRIFEEVVKEVDLEINTSVADSPIKLTRDRSIASEINKALLKTFQERYPDHAEQKGEIRNAISSWSGSSTNQEAAPIWAVAAQEGEDNIPSELESRVNNVDEEMVDATQAYVDHTREMLRDMFGDSVPIYRGVDGDYGTDKADELESNNNMEWNHRAAASWTLNPSTAKGFSYTEGTLMCQEVDVEDVLVCFANQAGFGGEFEMVASGGEQEYELADPSEGVDEFGPGQAARGKEWSEEDLFAHTFERFQEIAN